MAVDADGGRVLIGASLTVDCGGARHVVDLADGTAAAPVARDHDVDAELAHHRLGGGLPPCVGIVLAWQSADLTLAPVATRLPLFLAIEDRVALDGHVGPRNRAALDALAVALLRPAVEAQVESLVGSTTALRVEIGVIGSPYARRTTRGSEAGVAEGGVGGARAWVRLRLGFRWFRRVAAAGLAVVGGEPVVDAEDVIDGRTSLVTCTWQPWAGREWRLQPTSRVVERDDTGRWHPVDR